MLTHRNGGYENAPIFSNVLHKNGAMCERTITDILFAAICYNVDQCERTKTDVLPSFLSEKRAMPGGGVT